MSDLTVKKGTYISTTLKQYTSVDPQASSRVAQIMRATTNGNSFSASANLNYRSKYVSECTLTIKGTPTVAGRCTYVVRAYNDDGDEETLYFYIDVTEDKTAEIAYDANGGDGTIEATSATAVDYKTDGTISVPVTSSEPTYEGYVFLGWGTSASDASPTYQAGDSVSVGYGDTMTLYALWTEND